MTMSEPTFDADGYPTEETLRTIREWDVGNLADMAAAMDFAGRAWSGYGKWRCEPDFIDAGTMRPVRQYVFVTGGWSGNESIVAAIEANDMLQTVGAWSWRRGGRYEYRFPHGDKS